MDLKEGDLIWWSKNISTGNGILKTPAKFLHWTEDRAWIEVTDKMGNVVKKPVKKNSIKKRTE